jgi:hypothetical protein
MAEEIQVEAAGLLAAVAGPPAWQQAWSAGTTRALPARQQRALDADTSLLPAAPREDCWCQRPVYGALADSEERAAGEQHQLVNALPVAVLVLNRNQQQGRENKYQNRLKTMMQAKQLRNEAGMNTADSCQQNS